MRASPELIAHAAGIMLDAASTLADGCSPQLSMMEIEQSQLGDLPAAADLAGAHHAASATLAELLERVHELLSGDSDRLYQIAFGLQEVEQRATGRTRSAASVAHSHPGRST